MAEESGEGRKYQPGIVTFRPDNFLTVGLIFVIVYLAGALAAQALMRVGILPSQGSTAPARGPMAGTVATP